MRCGGLAAPHLLSRGDVEMLFCPLQELIETGDVGTRISIVARRKDELSVGAESRSEDIDKR